jgi:hypothetical protein
MTADPTYIPRRRLARLEDRTYRGVTPTGLLEKRSPDNGTTKIRVAEDHLERARAASAAIETHRAAMGAARLRRAAAVRDALDAGMSRSQIARALGVTPQAITKLLKEEV